MNSKVQVKDRQRSWASSSQLSLLHSTCALIYSTYARCLPRSEVFHFGLFCSTLRSAVHLARHKTSSHKSSRA